MVPKIEHIIGEGPELAESQKKVLDVLEKHPDYLFRMYDEDLQQLRAWAQAPDSPEPPRVYRDIDAYSINTIKWALTTLHARGKIGSIVLHRRTYYGSKEAIERTNEIERKAYEEKITAMKAHQPKIHTLKNK